MIFSDADESVRSLAVSGRCCAGSIADLRLCRSRTLDHSHDPVEALRAALCHVENEGKLASYSNLHQWNFSQEDGRFVIWYRSVPYDDMLHALPQADHIVVEAQNHHDTDWLHVRIRKAS